MPNSHSDSFKPKDYLVDFGEVYQIIKIRQQQNQGKKVTYVDYKSYFPSKTHEDLFCSIPISNLEKTTTRKPITKTQAIGYLKSLSAKLEDDVYFDDMDVTDILKQNDIARTLELIKIIWHDKQDPETNYSATKKQAFDDCLNQVTQELALVLNLTPQKARQKLLSSLRASR